MLNTKIEYQKHSAVLKLAILASATPTIKPKLMADNKAMHEQVYQAKQMVKGINDVLV